MAQGGNTTESYSYDAVGNRLTSLTVPSHTYNSSNELISTSRSSYAYDYNGNLTSKSNSSGTTSYAWDYENRLTSVTLPASGGTVTFKYDPFGRRIQKSGPSGTTNYLYDGANPVTDLYADGQILAGYMPGPGIDELLASLANSDTDFVFLESDGLGSITSLSNSSGAITDTYTYKPFGITTATGTTYNRFRYTGREWDSETSLYYYRARYYDQNIGRFISEDPARFNGRGPNFYAYVKNSPVGKFDPTGLATCDYYIQGPDGNGWLYCSPDDPRNSPVSFPAASGNNGDAQHQCKNNPDCASESGTGPIPPGHYHFSTDIGTHKHSGTLLIPDDPAAAYYRNGLLTHFCLNPFGPSRKKPFCSEGCITASQDDINALNDLLSSEPNNTMTVYPGLPLQ